MIQLMTKSERGGMTGKQMLTVIQGECMIPLKSHVPVLFEKNGITFIIKV